MPRRLARDAVVGVVAALLGFVALSASVGAARGPAHRSGARAAAVVRLWRDLRSLHYLAGPAAPPATYNAALAFAVLRFQSVNYLLPTGMPTAATWRTLDRAVHQDDALSPSALRWKVVVSEGRPEMVRVYHDGRLVVATPCNTGVPGAATPPGVFFVYEKLGFQVMRGTDVNGTKYAVPVHDIWYFYQADALHGYVRAAYGFPQSNGCVEITPAVAARLFPALPLGAEVEVVA